MEQELWKSIIGYENFYEVSNLGRVKSLDRITLPDKIHPLGQHICGKIKEATINKKSGYKSVILYKTKAKRICVHRLVAEAFIPNPDNKPEINHKNGIKTDNRVKNLEWVTKSENQIHRYNVLKQRMPCGKECKKSRIILQIKNNKIINYFYGSREAEKETGINHSAIIGCCINRKNFKTAGGFEWKYKE